MAQKDYVKNSGTKRRSTKKTQSSVPNLMIILAISVLFTFVGILYFVAKNNKPAPKPIQTKTQQRSDSTLPARPEERWSYIKELENREVISDVESQTQKPLNAEQRQILQSMQNDKAPAKEVASTQSTQQQIAQPQKWQIQCGSFKTLEGAEGVKAQLAFSGIESKIVSANGWSRVVIGVYKQKSQANESLNELKKAGVDSCIILGVEK